MLSRSVTALLSLGLSTFLSACILDSGAFDSQGGGGQGATSNVGGSGSASGGSDQGGGPGSGGTSGAAGSGASSSSAGSGGTTMPPKMCETSCDDQNPCTDDSCDMTVGMCVHPPSPAETAVSNMVPNDCLQEVCDGSGGIKPRPDDTEVPLPDNAQCHDLICQGGAAVPQPKNEGAECGEASEDICRISSTCEAGDCKVVNHPNGNNNFGCRSVTCTDGVSSSSKLHDEWCVDPNPDNCVVAVCLPEMDGGAGCYGVFAPNGKDCIKSNTGNPGDCNSVGHCCNGGGCD